MWCCNDVHAVMTYGTSAYYKAAPSAEQRATGVVPLDSLPAAWWNCMWCDTNSAINEARDAIGSFIDEVNTLLTNANIQPNCNCVDTIYRAINKIRQTIGDASVAGAVKSSSCPGEVSIDANGIMTANCVGNASALTTTARTVVGAVNELKCTYDCCISDINSTMGGKAPTSHASSATTYGVGTASDYGHLKISDTYTSLVGCACDGIAASQKALNDVYQLAASTSIDYYNYAGKAETYGGTSGSSSCVSRGDHTHPYPLYSKACSFIFCCFFEASFDDNLYCVTNHKFAPADYWVCMPRTGGNGAETNCVDDSCLTCLCLNPAYAEEGVSKWATRQCLAPYAFCPDACGRLTWRLEMPLFCVQRGCISACGGCSGWSYGDITVINCFSCAYLHVVGTECHCGDYSRSGSGDINVYLPPGCSARVYGCGLSVNGIGRIQYGYACVEVSVVRFMTCSQLCSCACANNAAWRNRLLHHVGMISN